MNYLIGFKQDDNDDARLNEYVRQRGNKWVVLSRKGKFSEPMTPNQMP